MIEVGLPLIPDGARPASLSDWARPAKCSRWSQARYLFIMECWGGGGGETVESYNTPAVLHDTILVMDKANILPISSEACFVLNLLLRVQWLTACFLSL
jgi:hypothetical protein